MLTLSAALFSAAAVWAAPVKPVDPMAVANGVPIRRQAVVERVMKLYGPAAVSELVDEALVRQAAAALGVAPDAAETEARLKRIRGQFADDATFKARLKTAGLSESELKAALEEPVLREALVAKAKNVTVTDAEVAEFYAANKERLGVPEAVHLRHLVLGSEKEAADFSVALRAGADFAKLAGSVSLDAATKERGGDLGFVSRGILAPEIEKAVFALKAGELGPVVRTPQGFHLFRVEESRAAKPAALDEVRADLRKALLADRLAQAWPGYLQELRAKAKVEYPKAQ